MSSLTSTRRWRRCVGCRFLGRRRDEVGQCINGPGDVEEDGVGVEVHGEFDAAVAHGGHGGSGVDAGGGEVGAEGVAEGVDVGDAVAGVFFGDAGGLEVGVEDADGRRAVEEFGIEIHAAAGAADGLAVGEVFTEFFDHVGAERQHGFASVFGVGGTEGEVRCGLGVEVELAYGQAGEFVVAKARRDGKQVEHGSFSAEAFQAFAADSLFGQSF